MKIIHVNDYFQTKVGYQDYFLSREHVKMGHDVYFITSNRINPRLFKNYNSLFKKRVIKEGFSIENGIKVWRLKPLYEHKKGIIFKNLEKKIMELNPDIVIMHGIIRDTALRVARLKLRKDVNFKLIYDCHMTYDNYTPSLQILYTLFKKFLVKDIIKSGDKFVAITPSIKPFMNQQYGIPLNKIDIIPLGADNILFKFNKEDRKNMRTKYNISINDLVFIYTGKIVPFKRMELLLTALKDLKHHNEIKLIIVGQGEPSYINKLKQLQSEYKLTNIEWIDAVPNNQLPYYYSGSDVAVWPRGASIGQIEAMACNLPIIISEKSMVTHLIEKENGFLFKENDPQDLATTMELLTIKERREEMGKKSREYVDSELNWKNIAEQFLT